MTRLPTLLLTRLRTLARQETRVLVAFGALAVLAYAFLKLASEMAEGETLAFDRWLIEALRAPGHPEIGGGPAWLSDTMIQITALGGGVVLTLVMLASAGLLLVQRKPATAALLAGAVTLGATLSHFLKLLFERARPDIVPHLVEVTGNSFPSGHAMNSAVVYLTLGAMLARAQKSRGVRAYLLTIAILLAVTIGVSRVYLGVHWPSDVIAGWCVGAAWALLAVMLEHWLQRGRQIEPAD